MVPIARAVVGAVFGAATMYWFDPRSGSRRRALLRQRMGSVGNELAAGVDVAARDLSHRARGVGSRIRSVMSTEEVSEEVLAERVRAALGRVVSHPGAIEVAAIHGQVTLTGAVLASEHSALLDAVISVRGVEYVLDELEVHERPDGIPALQGGRVLRPSSPAWMRETWSPGTRLLISASGGALLLLGVTQVFGARRRGVLGIAAIAAGGLLLSRSAANIPLRQLVGAKRERAIEIQKTIRIEAPIERVFDTLAQCENFPQFMRNVSEVRRNPDGSWHWTVAGPAGVPVEWDSQTTLYEQNQALGWRSVGDSAVAHGGIIRFERAGTGTRLYVRMSYTPPAGRLGHLAAKTFGADPKTELDEDLMRLKTFLETGIAPHDAARAAQPVSRPDSGKVH